jgi:hypothetical protein
MDLAVGFILGGGVRRSQPKLGSATWKIRAAFTWTENREIIDDAEFDRFFMPEIVKHRQDWDQ